MSVSFAVLYLVALALRSAPRPSNAAYVLGLLTLSWIFYAWHVPEYIALILFSTSVDYAAARLIAARASSVSTPFSIASRRVRGTPTFVGRST